MPLTNTGTLRVEEGVLTASAFPINDGRITLLNNATLATGNANLLNNGSIDGIGAINVGTGTLTNAGLLQPGSAGSAGLLSIQGNLVQTAAGSLEADPGHIARAAGRAAGQRQRGTRGRSHHHAGGRCHAEVRRTATPSSPVRPTVA